MEQVVSVAMSLGEPCIAGSAYFMDLAIASAFACACATSNSASDRTLVADSLFVFAGVHTYSWEAHYQRSFQFSNSFISLSPFNHNMGF